MSGVIGLTTAGQAIDVILSRDNPFFKRKLIKFLMKFSLKSRKLQSCLTSYDDKQFILNLLKDHYYKRLDVELKDKLTPSLFTHVQSYINALTRVNFVPNTKTQQSLMRKRMIHAKAEAKAVADTKEITPS